MKLIIYHNLNNDTYYYKIVRFHYFKDYYVGLINQYNHEIVLLIPNLKKFELFENKK